MQRLWISLTIACALAANADLLRDTSGGRAVATPELRPVSFVGIPRIASDGRHYFAAWSDFRYFNQDVFGSRIDERGTPLDVAGFPVQVSWRTDHVVSTVWNGREYVVFSTTEFIGSWATVIDPQNGRTNGIQLPTRGPTDAVWTGSGYVIIAIHTEMTDINGGRQMTLYFLDRNFQITRTEIIGDPNEAAYRVWLASDGNGNVLAVWETSRASLNLAYAQAFNSSGAPRAPRVEVARKDTSASTFYFGLEPDTIWNGSHYTMVWSENGVRGRNLSIDAAPSPVFIISEEAAAQLPSIGWDGMMHLVTWNIFGSDTSQIIHRAAFVTSTGVTVSPVEIGGVSVRFATHAQIASNGSTFYVHWFGANFLVWSTGFPRVEQTPDLTTAYRHQSRPAIAAAASHLLVAWQEGETVYASRLSRGGEPLDGSGIPVALNRALGDLRGIRVAATDRTFLVSWTQSDGEVRIARITAEGELLDPGGIRIGRSSEPPAMAALTGSFRLVWAESASAAFSTSQIVSLEVPERGPFAPPVGYVPLTPSPGFHQGVDGLFWSGTDWIIVLRQYVTPPCFGRLCPQPQYELKAVRLQLSGQVTSVSPRFLQTVWLYDVASNGSELLVLYWDRTALRTQRVSFTGERIGEAQQIGTISENPFAIRLARTSNGWLAIYEVYEDITINGPWKTIERAVPLNEQGAPTGPPVELFARSDAARIGGTVFAFGSTWTAYVSRWVPMPEAHENGLDRVYVRALNPRRRVMTR